MLTFLSIQTSITDPLTSKPYAAPARPATLFAVSNPYNKILSSKGGIPFIYSSYEVEVSGSGTRTCDSSMDSYPGTSTGASSIVGG